MDNQTFESIFDELFAKEEPDQEEFGIIECTFQDLQALASGHPAESRESWLKAIDRVIQLCHWGLVTYLDPEPGAWDKLIQHCRDVLVFKGAEYVRNGDRLWNFHRAAEIGQTNPVRAALGFSLKHHISVLDLLDEAYTSEQEYPGRENKELWYEKLGDTLNYCALILACAQDHYRWPQEIVPSRVGD